MENTNTAETPKQRKQAERKVSLTITQLQEMSAEPKLTKAFLQAYEMMPEAIAPILMATAKGMLAQQKLKI